MTVLAFDTCFSACSVAVGVQRPGRSRTLRSEFRLMETGHAEALMPMIERVMHEAGATYSDIDCIVVSHGPGTFTGVRTGVAAARALALATGARVNGVSSLWSQGVGAASRIPNCMRDHDAVLVAMDARKGMTYAQVIDVQAREVTEPMLLSAKQAAALSPDYRLFAVGTAAKQVAMAGDEAGRCIVADLDDLLAPEHHFTHADHLISRCEQRTCVNPLQPLYLRAPDAKPQADKSLPWSAP